MDKYLQKADKNAPRKQQNVARGKGGVQKQARLQDCKKVVKLDNSQNIISHEKILQLQGLLDSKSSSPAVLLHTLRYLDCLKLHTNDLTVSQIGRSVKALRTHASSEDVRRLARGIVDKWRAILVSEMAKS